jgi:hypothetical protein
MKSVKSKPEITDVKDYLDPDREIVCFTFEADSNGMRVATRKAPPPTSSRIVPAAGCVVCLGGNSVSYRSLYELSGLSLFPRLNLDEPVYKAFGYCEERSLERAKQNFVAMAREAVQKESEILRRTLETHKRIHNILDSGK